MCRWSPVKPVHSHGDWFVCRLCLVKLVHSHGGLQFLCRWCLVKLVHSHGGYGLCADGVWLNWSTHMVNMVCGNCVLVKLVYSHGIYGLCADGVWLNWSTQMVATIRVHMGVKPVHSQGCYDLCVGGVRLRTRGHKPGWTDCHCGVIQGNTGYYAGRTVQNTWPALLCRQPISEDMSTKKTKTKKPNSLLLPSARLCH